jgi:3-oxoadipate enol-lactonase
MRTSERTIDGTRFRVEGSGPPVVLIHGVGMDLFMWEAVARELARQHSVIRFDMIGHGGSPKPAGPYHLADFVEQVRNLADFLALATFDVVGFSMGGLIAQGFAVRYPHRLRSLVLLNTVYRRSPAERAAIAARVADVRNGGYVPSVETALDRWFTPAFRESRPEVVAGVRRRLFTNDLEAYANAYEVFATADAELEDTAADIGCPTLVTTGAEDQRSTAAMAAALAADIPEGRCEIIAGQRHMMPLEIPERLAASISRFVRGERATVESSMQ